MTGGDDDYGDAFKEAKLEHDQRRQGPTEEQRLQAEADADAAVLSDVVLPQLQAAAEELEPLGGRVEIRRYGRTGKSLTARVDCFPHNGSARSVGLWKGPPKPRLFDCSTRGWSRSPRRRFRRDRPAETTRECKQEIGIQRRDDVTIENVKKLIMRAIEEYRNDRDPHRRADNNDHLK